MLTESIKSFVENIKERVRNPFSERNTTPFAGAFIIALIIYNWQLFFSLFAFDGNDSRLQKIEIIKEYLIKESWERRIGMPILIAFGTIAFYYLFNNISLGLTIFFNRWFKATVLFLTDRSKIVPKEELNSAMQKMSNVMTRYEGLKKTFAESLVEIEGLKRMIEEKEKERTALVIDKSKIEEAMGQNNLKLVLFFISSLFKPNKKA